MEMDDYLCYLETLWTYLPYMVYAFVFLTLVPKSFCRIKSFADEDYEANRGKYHKCYGPETCCHVRALNGEDGTIKPKPRRVVTRVYPKRKVSTASACDNNEADKYEPVAVKRQVNPSTIQTQTNVNQIAQMFETSSTSKKINRVTPTVLPETRPQPIPTAAMLERAQSGEEYVVKSAHLAQLLQDLENRENSKNKAKESFHNYVNGEYLQSDWKSEPLVQRRNMPRSLTFAGTSSTPSTGSPGECSPTLDSPPSSDSVVQSPVLRMAPLNLKTSLEDIFIAIAKNAEDQFLYAGGCRSLSPPPVTSIDDILSQRRLSRPLSAYSISDLLNEEQLQGGVSTNTSDAYVSNLLCSLNTS